MDVASPVPANLMDDNGNTNDVAFLVEEETKCGTTDVKMEAATGGNTQEIKQNKVRTRSHHSLRAFKDLKIGLGLSKNFSAIFFSRQTRQ